MLDRTAKMKNQMMWDSDGKDAVSRPLPTVPHMAPVIMEPGTEKQDESRDVSSPHEERNRDYYEFKEEIQYMRL